MRTALSLARPFAASSSPSWFRRSRISLSSSRLQKTNEVFSKSIGNRISPGVLLARKSESKSEDRSRLAVVVTVFLSQHFLRGFLFLIFDFFFLPKVSQSIRCSLLPSPLAATPPCLLLLWRFEDTFACAHTSRIGRGTTASRAQGRCIRYP